MTSALSSRLFLLFLFVATIGCRGQLAALDPDVSSDVRARNRCGDKVCGGAESCSSCPGDCGACPAPSPTCLTSAASWQGASFPPQVGTFRAELDATPDNRGVDGVIGLSSGLAVAWTDLAAIVRFKADGLIDARDGDVYVAAGAIPYAAGVRYHLRLDVDVAAHRYSAYVTPQGGAELSIGVGLAFRTEQAAVGSLAEASAYAAVGSQRLCDLTVTAIAPAIGFSPPMLSFPAQAVGSTSAVAYVTLTNAGSAVVGLPPTLTISGGDFAFAGLGTCTTSVAPGGSCTISVRFAPSAVGARSGAVTIYDDAPGAPHVIPLVGTGVAAVSDVRCTATLSPGAAIEPAFAALAPGDVLCLHAGRYGGPSSNVALRNSGTPDHPIVLTTVPGEAPATIEGAFAIGVNSPGQHQHDVTVSHLDFDLDYMGTRVNGSAAGCTDASVQGIQLNGGNLTFEYNDVTEAGVGPQYRDTPLGVNFVPGLVEPGVVIRKNKIHDYGACDHFDHGIYLDFISSGEVSGNWIWNGGCSYGMGGGDHARGCGAGIQLWVAPTGLSIHGNVIDGTGIGFYYSGSGNSIYDNVVVNLRGMYTQSGGVEPAVAYNGYAGSASNTFHDNDWWNAGGFCDNCTATSSGNVSADPLFVDAAHHDYRLQTGSPAAAWGLWDGSGR